MNRQKLITILAAITIMAILSVSLLFTQLRVTAYPTNTYDTDGMTVNGVLATDNYVLYPYTQKNLIFGFSKYGELINSEVDPEQGLEYDGLDVFANPNVAKKDWSQGWLIDIHYVDESNNYKRAWAFALYTDLTGTTGIGGDWKEGCTAKDGSDGNHGGRKTNVWAKTDPIEVLYDGPRRFVAVTNTTLYDTSDETAEDALVSVTITFVFNKDKKQVTLFKDIKRLRTGKFGSKFQVEFSNRGEWDIGTSAAPPSYAYFYDNLTTSYGADYHDFYTDSGYNLTGYDVCQMIDESGSYVGWAAYWPQLYGKDVEGTTGELGDKITISAIRESLCTMEYNQTWDELGTPANKQIIFGNYTWPDATYYPTGLGESTDEPMVFKNGVHMASGEYIWTRPDNITLTTTEPADTDYITIVYKHELNNETKNMDVTEPQTPYVIGEWCFDLRNEDYKRQFRAVTMYGLTDWHDADDDDATGETWTNGANVIDSEVQYYLNETFNPYDLNDAVHKQESRWVDFTTVLLPLTTDTVQLTEGLDDDIYQPNGYVGGSVTTSSTTWTGYNYTEDNTATFAWLNNFENGAVAGTDANSKNWMAHLNATLPAETMLKITPTGFGVNITGGSLNFSSIVDFGFWYYNNPNAGIGPSIEFELYANNGSGYIAFGAYPNDGDAPNPTTEEWIHYTLNDIESFIGDGTSDNAFYIKWLPIAGMTDDLDATIDYSGTGNKHSWEWFQHRLGSFKVGSVGISARNEGGDRFADCYVDDLSIAYLDRTSGIRYERVYNMEEDKLIPSDWDAYCSFAERVLVNGTLAERVTSFSTPATYLEYTINFETGLITFGTTLPVGTDIVKVLYSTIEENAKGRYEWMVVGKNAAAIDSIGAAYMTQAFDSRKDIEVLLTGLDINDTVNGPHAPFVMGGAVTGTRTNYYFDYPSDNRSGLRDDWCHTYPVASSNMLFAGGPRAQLGTEYFNEFTMAFFARSEYVVNNTGQANKIFALSCWNRYTYGAGYAVISVYKDLNGTIGFLIWGFDGQDTYYATKWFWDEGIEYLQTENRGVTDIILEIDYTTCPYSASITDERLGTISEKTPHDC